MDKAEFRKELLRRRDSLTESERVKLSGHIAERLFAMDVYKNAKTVLSYASFRSEVITDEINRRILHDDKELYLPKTYVKEKELRFFRVADLEKDLVSGAMGIREPKEDKTLEYPYRQEIRSGKQMKTKTASSEPDRIVALPAVLVLMPGVAFDSSGNRMGYGGGFYDRFFAAYSELQEASLLLAYRIQMADALPVDPTDQKPKHILTEEGVL